ncbi:MAG: bifunctional dihydrofolate synthase/folylpolyglutamate synthase, partial [Caulobacteraceae bacterium]|nr:bifunctional dihydrofolate synthase/folylpolyglutamate synthase [Caulobacteraceae bacterium]
MKPNPYDQVRAFDAMMAVVRDRHPILIDLTLHRIERLLEKLGRPQDRLPPVIHIAGTNGKGSTAAYLRAIGEAAALSVHVLTSPHLVRFAERIRLAGRLISDDYMAELVGRLEQVNGEEPLSFFELMTAVAIQAFAETPADLCIVEVGLGGRYDATNVFAWPAVTVITPVDYDHTELLGPTLAKIAGEKAGILRKGVPCVTARQPQEAFEVIEQAADGLQAPLMALGRDFDAWEERGGLLVQMPDRLLDLPMPSLFGAHQVDNAAVAVAAALALNHVAIDDDAIGKGIASANWPARFQRLTAGPVAAAAKLRGGVVWLDGGHNPHAAQALAASLPRLLARDPRPLKLIVGMLDRKDAGGFFAAFRDLDPEVVTTGFDSPNATPAELLAERATDAGLRATPAANIADALELALADDGPAPHILICGGLYFAGEVLALSPETWP